eukprot:12403405-Karenia_brevis.AAC.1
MRLAFLPILLKKFTDGCRAMQQIPRDKTPGSCSWMDETEYFTTKFDKWWQQDKYNSKYRDHCQCRKWNPFVKNYLNAPGITRRT